ncbi:methylmalonyl-CoA epimerase, mitochondrial [Narcine bancroftii]|uniref:methylmalonyl-CoA epimerase, mitochondrial n=1 Tax=Narcine bancroftii TaxID=1343680 RepID=UPI0038311DB5
MAAFTLSVAAGARALSSAARDAAWKLGRLNHVAIAVPEMEKARSFYREVLGGRVSEAVPLAEHGVSTSFVELGNAKLELLEPLGPDSPILGFLRSRGLGGIHHICIEVERLPAAVQQLRAHRVRTLSPGPQIGAHGKPVIFLHPKDCGGVLVELEEA